MKAVFFFGPRVLSSVVDELCQSQLAHHMLASRHLFAKAKHRADRPHMETSLLSVGTTMAMLTSRSLMLPLHRSVKTVSETSYQEE